MRNSFIPNVIEIVWESNKQHAKMHKLPIVFQSQVKHENEYTNPIKECRPCPSHSNQNNSSNLVELCSYRVQCDCSKFILHTRYLDTRCTCNVYKTAREYWIDKKIVSAYRLVYFETIILHNALPLEEWKISYIRFFHFFFLFALSKLVRSCSKDDVQNVSMKVHFSHWMTANTKKNECWIWNNILAALPPSSQYPIVVRSKWYVILGCGSMVDFNLREENDEIFSFRFFCLF